MCIWAVSLNEEYFFACVNKYSELLVTYILCQNIDIRMLMTLKVLEFVLKR